MLLRKTQRDIIQLDPLFREGRYEPHDPPLRAVRLARQVAMIAYRSRAEFDERFKWDVVGSTRTREPSFEVEVRGGRCGRGGAGR